MPLEGVGALAAPVEEEMTRLEREARFDRILAEHGRALRRVAATYEWDSHRREDLLQEIGLALWQALPSFRGECSERTFVFRVAHNRCLTHAWRQRAALRKAEVEEAEALPDPRQGPEALAEEGQRRCRLRAAVQRLPLGARHVVTLTLEGLSQREIGEVLGISENNVAVRVSRARRLLRQALGVEGGEP